MMVSTKSIYNRRVLIKEQFWKLVNIAWKEFGCGWQKAVNVTEGQLIYPEILLFSLKFWTSEKHQKELR